MATFKVGDMYNLLHDPRGATVSHVHSNLLINSKGLVQVISYKHICLDYLKNYSTSLYFRVKFMRASNIQKVIH